MNAGEGIFPPDAELTTLPGIDEKKRGALEQKGIMNVKDISTADPKVVAEVLKISLTNARSLVKMANDVILKH